MNWMEMMKTHRTYRRFDQARPIPDDVIDMIMETARISSSATNAQPLRYLVIRSREEVEKLFPLTHFAAALPPELGVPKPGEHPVLYVLMMTESAKKNRWTDMDAGIAMANMTAAAWTEGVGSVILGNIERPKIMELFDIPEEMELIVGIAFGYPTHASTVVDVPESGSLKYYLDENKDYYVPKRPMDEIVKII